MGTPNHLNRLINQYYDRNVTMCRQETSESAEYVSELVGRILNEVHALDGNFMAEPIKTGSSFQGLKVERPDEFDYSIKLKAIHPSCSWEWAKDKRKRNRDPRLGEIVDVLHCRFYGFDKPDIPDPATSAREDVRIVNTPWAPLPTPPIDCVFLRDNGSYLMNSSADDDARLVHDGDIVPFLVKKRLKKLVEQAVRNLDLTDRVRVRKIIRGPATTLVVNFATVDYPISIDLSPIISTDLPLPSDMQWPRPGKKWPSPDKVDRVKSKGIDFVAKRNFYWSITTVKWEKELLEGMDSDGGCRKKCQRILKKLKESWQEKHVKPVLSSYCLKNALYWECEDHPNQYEWSQDKLGKRIKCMATRLLKWLKNEKVPWYFDPAKDVLNLKEDDGRHLAAIIRNMETFLDDSETFMEDQLSKA